MILKTHFYKVCFHGNLVCCFKKIIFFAFSVESVNDIGYLAIFDPHKCLSSHILGSQTRINNLKRDPLKIQHQKFEKYKLGLV